MEIINIKKVSEKWKVVLSKVGEGGNAANRICFVQKKFNSLALNNGSIETLRKLLLEKKNQSLAAAAAFRKGLESLDEVEQLRRPLIKKAVESYVDGLLQSHKVVVFSKCNNHHCQKARAALDSVSVKPEAIQWIEIDGFEECVEIQNRLGVLTGARSVPRVFINGKFFGGEDEIDAAAKNGELAKLLQEAGAI